MNIELRDELRKLYQQVFIIADENNDKHTHASKVMKLKTFIMSKVDFETYMTDNDLMMSDTPFDCIRIEGDKVYCGFEPKFFNNYNYFDLEGEDTLKYVPELYLKDMAFGVKGSFTIAWEYNDSKRVVISHNHCNDGHGVVGVIKEHAANFLTDEQANNITYLMLDHNTYDFDSILETCKDALVYIGDFSFDATRLDAIEEVARQVVTVDHHDKVFNSDLADRDNVLVDKSKSGALLAWEFFFTKDEYVPTIIELISDRDLWNFFYGDAARALDMYLNEHGKENVYKFVRVDEEQRLNVEEDLMEIIEEYEKRVVSKREADTKRAKTAITYKVFDQEVVGLNHTSSVSDMLNICSELNNRASFAWWMMNDSNAIQLSFRDATNVNDVNKLCSALGGGGHAAAAGSVIPVNQLDYEEFFINKRIVVKYLVEEVNGMSDYFITLDEDKTLEEVLAKNEIYRRKSDNVICIKEK